MSKKLYTFAVRTCDPEDVELISHYIPEGEDPVLYFEAMTGERVYHYWQSKSRKLPARALIHEEDMSND